MSKNVNNDVSKDPPIASRCSDIVFQKRYELEAIYIIVFVIGSTAQYRSLPDIKTSWQ